MTLSSWPVLLEKKCSIGMFFPNLAITPGATAVTGIYVKNGEMFVHNTRVQSVSVEKCIEELAEWLKQFHKPLLVCHNGRAFDYYFIEKLYENSMLFAI